MTQGILSNLKIGSAVSDVKPLHSCIDPKIIPKCRDLRTGKNWKISDQLGPSPWIKRFVDPCQTDLLEITENMPLHELHT